LGVLAQLRRRLNPLKKVESVKENFKQKHNTLRNKMTIMTKLHINIFLSILIVCLLSITNLNAQKKTNLILTGGASINLNSHLADFKTFEGVPSANPGYSSAFGFGYGIYAGFEYKWKNNLLFGKDDLRLSLNFAYANLSANFSNEEMFGHVIAGKEYTDAVRDFVLEASVNAILIEPGVVYYPWTDMPLAFRLGIQAGFPVGMTYYQAEKFVSPDGVTFENGERITGEREGDIPNPASFIFGLSAAVRYEIYTMNNMIFSPEVKLNYGLTDLADGTNWTANSLTIGITVQYHTMTAKPKPAMLEPLPPKPAPPLQSEMTADFEIYANNKIVNDGDKVTISLIEYKSVTNQPLMPRLFCKYQGKSLNASTDAIKDQTLKSVVDYLKLNPNVKAELLIVSLDDDHANSEDKREDLIISRLKKMGVAADRVEVDKKIIDRNSLKHDEMVEDYSYVEFRFSDGNILLNNRTEELLKRDLVPLPINLRTKSVSDVGNISVTGSVRGEDFEQSISDADTEILIDKNIIEDKANYKNYDLTFTINVSDGVGQSKEIIKTITLQPEIQQKHSYENVVGDINILALSHPQEYTLGFFEFDRSAFSVINKDALRTIKAAIVAGKRIEIIPSNDNYGLAEHNESLSRKRANSALRLLGVNAEDVKITFPDSFNYSNATPYGRMMNRSVTVVIGSN
jgi:outer membrane protein OmpA-like peptidoglycan-associated protein